MGALHAFPSFVAEEEAPLYDTRPRAKKGSPEPSPVNMFGMVPACVFGQVEPGAVCVYAALAQYTRPDGRANASVDVLVGLIKNVSRPTVMKHIQALASAGLIVISERKRGSTKSFEYFLPHHPSVKKLDRSDINDADDRSKFFTGDQSRNLTGDDATGQETLPVTGQKSLPVEPANNDDRSKNFTGSGQNTLPVPVKKFDHYHKEVNEKENNQSETDSAPSKKPNRVYEVAEWYATKVGGAIPGRGAREWQDAKRLAGYGVGNDELDELFSWLGEQSWVESISLGLMSAKYNDWRSSLVVAAKPKPVAHNSPRSTKPVF
jgi:hypothetical protein